MELAEIHEVVATRLRGDDQRYTDKRKALVEVLQRSGRPLSMPSILEQSPGMAQSSVYRNLAVLEHALAAGERGQAEEDETAGGRSSAGRSRRESPPRPAGPSDCGGGTGRRLGPCRRR